MWETLPNNADWDCFKTPILQGILRIQNLHQVEHCVFSEAMRLFQSVGCVRNKLQFSHCSTEWVLIVAVLHGNTYQSNQERGDPCTNLVRVNPHKLPTRKKFHGVVNDLDNVEFIPSNVQSSHQEASLCVFEDNEAVIKMIIKGRSPTMRHVSRTHGVALDWLFDRINSDPKIQIKYIDTKNQLADILTKGNFTRAEWNHLSCLFNISHFSSIIVLKRCRKEHKKMQVKKESQQNQSR